MLIQMFIPPEGPAASRLSPPKLAGSASESSSSKKYVSVDLCSHAGNNSQQSLRWKSCQPQKHGARMQQNISKQGSTLTCKTNKVIQQQTRLTPVQHVCCLIISLKTTGHISVFLQKRYWLHSDRSVTTTTTTTKWWWGDCNSLPPLWKCLIRFMRSFGSGCEAEDKLDPCHDNQSQSTHLCSHKFIYYSHFTSTII